MPPTASKTYSQSLVKTMKIFESSTLRTIRKTRRGKARTFLRNQDINGKVDFIKYGEEACEGETLYRAIHSCQNHEIIVLLRGDEFLLKTVCLKN